MTTTTGKVSPMLIERISARTRVPVTSLSAIARNASRRYKVYLIPKRNGGMREISHPSKPLKAVQRWLTRNILKLAPVHASATAYRKGASIKANADVHVGSAYTLRMDFSNFFPSFDAASVALFLKDILEKNDVDHVQSDIEFLVKIFCRNGQLTIGAPSSPSLTNAMMYKFDEFISDFCLSNDVIYTRYADDMFFSCSVAEKLDALQGVVESHVATLEQPRLQLNASKTIHLSKAGHRTVTGLVLTPQGKVSLGRDRKREIKSMVFRMTKKTLEPHDVGRLKGLIAFANDVEPAFVARLSQKFDFDVMGWAKKNK